MNQTLKRAISGSVYVSIMWFGTSFHITFHYLFILLLLMALYEIYQLRKGKTKIIPFLYVIIPLIIIHTMPLYLYGEICVNCYSYFDPSIILFMLTLTWTFDTFAYLIGVKFGKSKILPSISPKKSWEGFVGGFMSTVIVSCLTYKYFEFNSLQLPFIIGVILPFTATIGDFIESHYKREAGMKDSGNLIPGHGGILDRIDSLMITIPILYILTNLI